MTLAVWGVPNASKRWTKSEVAAMWASWLHDACHLRATSASKLGTKSDMAQMWDYRLHNPYHVGGPNTSKRETSSDLSLVAAYHVPSKGFGGSDIIKRAGNGPRGDITPTV